MICNRCAKKFKKEDAEDIFTSEYPSKAYGNFKQILCGKCAIKAIEDEEEGVYFEICEKCQKEYDPVSAESEFEEMFASLDYGRYEYVLNYTNLFLCADCAMEYYDEICE